MAGVATAVADKYDPHLRIFKIAAEEGDTHSRDKPLSKNCEYIIAHAGIDWSQLVVTVDG